MPQGRVLLIRRREQILTLLMDGRRLISVRAAEAENASLVGNIYIGKVKNIVNNIEAAFVEIAGGVLCYLPFSELEYPVFTNRRAPEMGKKFDGRLRIGDELLVQVVRDALKTKQPALTTKLSFAGHYLVLAVGNEHLGLSSKLPAQQKRQIRSVLFTNGMIEENGCVIPHMRESEQIKSDFMPVSTPPYNMVVRTNAGSLDGDMKPLLEEWNALEQKFIQMLSVALYRPCFTCLNASPFVFLSALKDFYRDSYEEIITDDPWIYDVLQEFCREHMPDISGIIQLYQDERISLSALYGIESRLQEALKPRVWLKSGGYLIIEPTEALTVIDVNTGKYDAKKTAPADTFYRINMEAAQEIAFQIRLRNLSGIIIVDFISMESEEHKNELLKLLKELVRKDSVRTDVIDITPLGLVEITRRKISKPLSEQIQL
ncbi:MAG: ribonuclease E/G [Lachnospiraceae bacterium]|nr:ribonuclease E/G [Lachnospiraceae bacterium]